MRTELEQAADPSNADFAAKLCPGIGREQILGIKSPVLKQFAVNMMKEGTAEAFLNDLPHRYLDENTLHAVLISKMKDYASCLQRLEQFLPFIDCWVVTDSIRPKVFRKHTEELEPMLYSWLESKEPYIVRTAMGLFMAYYLDDAFKQEQAERIASVRMDHYYVRMMAAWYTATALAKQEAAVLPLLEEGKLDAWTHNKAIQKAAESYRIAPQMKEYLRQPRRK